MAKLEICPISRYSRFRAIVAALRTIGRVALVLVYYRKSWEQFSALLEYGADARPRAPQCMNNQAGPVPHSP